MPVEASCLFLSHKNDLHTAVVAKLLRDWAGLQVEVVATDDIASGPGLTFFSTSGLGDGAVASLLQDRYDLVWSRRTRMAQRGCATLDAEAEAFVNAECAAAFEGFCQLAGPKVTVVNPILAERRAESKIWQLRLAQGIGFRIPQTLCSNDPRRIQEAVKAIGGSAIVKKLRGTRHRTPLTLRVEPEMLADTQGLRAAPVILQELVEARCHYRVNVFLDQVIACRIESERLDWRPEAGRGATVCTLDDTLTALCRRFREACGLYYCVLDLVEDRDGTPYFLECNPQGQFLFLEHSSGAPLSVAFATMLLHLVGLEERSSLLPVELPLAS